MGDGPLHELSIGGWNKTLELNLTSLMLSNQAAVRKFLELKKAGTILNMGSVLGFSPSPLYFSTHGVPAKHNEIERDSNGNCRFMGYVIDCGKYKIYHSGDTLWFDEMIDLLKPFAVDVAILPINGNSLERKVAGNLSCEEAARLGKAINAKCVIPCHYDMFEFNTADVNDFIIQAQKIKQPFAVLKGGQLFTGN